MLFHVHCHSPPTGETWDLTVRRACRGGDRPEDKPVWTWKPKLGQPPSPPCCLPTSTRADWPPAACRVPSNLSHRLSTCSVSRGFQCVRQTFSCCHSTFFYPLQHAVQKRFFVDKYTPAYSNRAIAAIASHSRATVQMFSPLLFFLQVVCWRYSRIQTNSSTSDETSRIIKIT